MPCYKVMQKAANGTVTASKGSGGLSEFAVRSAQKADDKKSLWGYEEERS